jgi:outer membrane protein OmpA-like peptidoglycan-associated protein
MSKRVMFPLIAVIGIGIVATSLGCQAHAEGKIGSAEPKAATPPPDPPPPPAPEPPPPPKPVKALGKAKIENNEIKIPGKVHFETDKATIKEDKETKEILQTVADVMKENTQITKLRIEGHTDDQGGKEHNQRLSDGRASSVVEWLAKAGVDKGRLDAKGFGEDHPLVPNSDAKNREQNRRVEFKLWELDGKPTEAATAAANAPATPAATPAGKDAKDAKKDDKKGATPATPATPASAGGAATPATPATPPKK